MDSDILPSLAHPELRTGRSGKAHGFGKRGVDLAVLQLGERPLVTRIGLRRRPVRLAYLDQRVELALELRPPSVLGSGRAKLRSQSAILVSELVELHRRMRAGDDPCDRSGMRSAEAVDEQRLEEAESNAPIDRTARCEGDEKGVGASRGALDTLGRALDARQSGLQLGNPLGVRRFGPRLPARQPERPSVRVRAMT